ncbi:MAG: hypothetical protein JWM98_756 [Thermoleophilia bacterium]|nr:hypothetical protein [Thermoleophilia bacterium]
MTDPAVTPAPPSPAAPTERAGHGHLLLLVRATLLVVALVVAWLAIGWWWTTGMEDDALFEAGRLAVTVGFAALSALWIASLRVQALRRGLAPFEAGIVVGAAVFAAGQRGTEVDNIGDAAIVATFVGVGAALAVAFVALLLVHRRSAPAWCAGVMAVAAALGIALPALADHLTANPGEFNVSQDEVSYRESLAIATVTDDGYVRLGGGLGPDSFVGPDPTGGPVALATPVDPELIDTTLPTGEATTFDPATGGPAPAFPAGPDAGSGVLLLADDAGHLQLRVPATLGAPGAHLRLELRRGSCSDAEVGVAATVSPVVWRTTVAGGVAHRLAVPGLTLGDIALHERLHAVAGTGAPLAAVHCTDLVTLESIALARNGGTRFAEQCVRPLHLEPGQRSGLTAASFQDPRCATQLHRLGRLATSALVPDRTKADVERCIGDSEGGNAAVRALQGGGVSVELRDPAKGVVGERFSTCTTPDAVASVQPDPEYDTAAERAAVAAKLR